MDADTVACQKIINAETPFECFELPTEEVDPELVRTLYLKIAVRIHPDKNKSDLATQAFQVHIQLVFNLVFDKTETRFFLNIMLVHLLSTSCNP